SPSPTCCPSGCRSRAAKTASRWFLSVWSGTSRGRARAGGFCHAKPQSERRSARRSGAARRMDRILAMDLDAILSPPLVTADLPGIGGRIKTELEDFEVEEVPAYEPAGAGDFLYLWIEKRDMGAEYFTRQVAKRLDVAVGEVGAAGLKDRR